MPIYFFRRRLIVQRPHCGRRIEWISQMDSLRRFNQAIYQFVINSPLNPYPFSRATYLTGIEKAAIRYSAGHDVEISVIENDSRAISTQF